MYLAGILGLCALLALPASGSAGSGLAFFALQENQNPSQPTPEVPAGTGSQPQQEPPPSGATESDPPKAKTPAPHSTARKPTVSKKRSGSKNKNAAPPAGQDATKTVVKHGSTSEPTTQLSPGITDEQAARQRESTNQLLTSTDATLQKLDVSQLSSDQKETIVQIRKFMEQAKAADAEGDPQRSYKLALKAHLLSDALEKQ
jgi:outer membrane biosynthesis protein TonB